METLLRAVPLTLALLVATSVAADVLTIRDGRAIQGTYRGGTQQAIHFEVNGAVQAYQLTDVMALTFATSAAATPKPKPATPAASATTPTATAATSPTTTPATTTAAQPTAAATAPAVRTLNVPAGTRLRVRMADTLDPRRNAAEDRFAAMLDTPLVADGVTVAAAGSKVYGEVAEANAAGPAGSRLKLELTELMIQGQTLKIVTGTHQVVETAAAPETTPAKASGEGTGIHADRIQGGAILEFRLLQPVALRTR